MLSAGWESSLTGYPSCALVSSGLVFPQGHLASPLNCGLVPLCCLAKSNIYQRRRLLRWQTCSDEMSRSQGLFLNDFLLWFDQLQRRTTDMVSFSALLKPRSYWSFMCDMVRNKGTNYPVLEKHICGCFLAEPTMHMKEQLTKVLSSKTG